MLAVGDHPHILAGVEVKPPPSKGLRLLFNYLPHRFSVLPTAWSYYQLRTLGSSRNILTDINQIGEAGCFSDQNSDWNSWKIPLCILFLRKFNAAKLNDSNLSIVSCSNFVRKAKGSRIPISEEFLCQKKASAIE